MVFTNNELSFYISRRNQISDLLFKDKRPVDINQKINKC